MKKVLLISITSLIILLIVLLLFINNKSTSNKIIGSWSLDKTTIYEFNDNNEGKMKVSLNEYEFIYKIDNNKLFIDFKDESLSNFEYIFTLNQDSLILKGDNGEFNFTRIH